MILSTSANFYIGPYFLKVADQKESLRYSISYRIFDSPSRQK